MRINISLDDEVITMADNLAQNMGLSRSGLISYLIANKRNSRQYGYTWEKLHCAILSLTSDGEEWQRIGYAYMAIHTLNRNDFPEHLRNEYDRLQSIMRQYDNANFAARKSKNGPYDGLFFFAAQNMVDDEKRACRQIFVSLHDSITRYQPEA